MALLKFFSCTGLKYLDANSQYSIPDYYFEDLDIYELTVYVSAPMEQNPTCDMTYQAHLSNLEFSNI
jgi:hypothetical protein